MNFQNSKYELVIAAEADADEILELFESVDFAGGISVTFTRRPNPVKSLRIDGEEVFIPMIRDRSNKKICGIGCCIIRRAYVNGEIKNTGYLTALKIHKDYRRKMPYIADVYRFIYENTKDRVDLFYTTILDDNAPALGMLEKKRKNMPEYQYLGRYTTYCFTKSKWGFCRIRGAGQEYVFEKGNSAGLKEFYHENLPKYNLAPTSIKLCDIHEEDFYSIRGKCGDILAACTIWNQQHYKQYIVKKYSGVYQYLKMLPTEMLGYPAFPKIGVPVDYACIALFAVKNNDRDIGLYLLKRVIESMKGYDLLMFGMFENHEMNAAFQQIKHIKYGSRFYIVSWDEESVPLDERKVSLEVGLL